MVSQEAVVREFLPARNCGILILAIALARGIIVGNQEASPLAAAPGLESVGLGAMARLVERGKKHDSRSIAGQEVVADFGAVNLHIAQRTHLHL